jgi:hypothetical protein
VAEVSEYFVAPVVCDALVHQPPSRSMGSRCGQYVGMKWNLIRHPGRTSQASTSRKWFSSG